MNNIPFLNWRQTLAEFLTAKTNYGGFILLAVAGIFVLKGDMTNAAAFLGLAITALGLSDRIAPSK